MTKLSQEQHFKIWRDYHNGKVHTKARKYLYSLEYRPELGNMPWQISRRSITGGRWQIVCPLAENMQFTPRDSYWRCPTKVWEAK